MFVNILVLSAIILLNAYLSMTELAIVSSRRVRLAARAEEGSHGAKAALMLRDNPARLLSVVQVGITLGSILSGAYGGATLGVQLGEVLTQIPWIGEKGEELAIFIVVAVVSYLSIVVGELSPKQIGLRFADKLAWRCALPIVFLSIILRPLVWFLEASNRFVLFALRIGEEEQEKISEEEVKAVIAEGASSGALDENEKRMMEAVMRMADLPVSVIMTHRQDIVWFDVSDTNTEIVDGIREHHHSHYLLCEKEIQHIRGVVSAKDLAVAFETGGAVDLTALAHEPLMIPEAMSVLSALEAFRTTALHLAIVRDEHGVIQGVVTLKDILEAIVGTLPEHHAEAGKILRRADGSYLVDGLLPIYTIEEELGIRHMQGERDDFNTLAGFVLHHLQSLPREGDILNWHDWQFEIIDMDERRIDKVLVTRADSDEQE